MNSDTRRAPGRQLVSVVMIFRDAGQFIDEAIASVEAQTYSDWELILVDDGSIDASTEIAARHAAADPDRIRVVEHPEHRNLGMSASRNLGVSLARGSLVAFLDADDVYRPCKLEVQVGLLAAHPTAAMVYGRTEHWYSWAGSRADEPRRLGVEPDTLVHPPTLVPLFLRGEAQTPGTCGLLVRRDALLAVGGFDPAFTGMFEDQVMLTKLCLDHDVFVEGGSWDRYRQHPGSHTRTSRRAGQWRATTSVTHERYLRWLSGHLDARPDRDAPHLADVRAALAEQLHPYEEDRRHRPRPAPVTAQMVEGGSRPRWSVMLPTYHCAAHVAHALGSVLAQDLGQHAMQIAVVDDASARDDPIAAAAAIAPAGRVELVRHARNLGNVRTFNDCLARSRGELVHILHGDDGVRPGFYARMEQVFAEHPDVIAAFCRHAVIDEAGHELHLAQPVQPHAGVVDGWLELIAAGQRLQPPAMVVRRSVYEAIGGFDQRIRAYGEDWEMWTRIAAHGPVWYEPAALAEYRVHTRSISGRTLRTGENMHDIRTVIELNKQVLPAARADAITARSRRNNAEGALRRALRLYDSGDHAGAERQFREALRTSHDPTVLWAAAVVVARVAWRKVIRA